jgi:transposase-like protein
VCYSYPKIAKGGRRVTYLDRAVDSTGETIDLMLSPKRDKVAAKHFLRMAVWWAGQMWT